MEGYTKIGRIRPNYTGTWNAETAYTALEMVKNEAGTASYIAKQDVPAGTPLTNEAYWAMVLDAGDVIAAAEQAAADANKAAQGYSELDGKVERISEEVADKLGGEVFRGMKTRIEPDYESGTISSTTGEPLNNVNVVRTS